MSLKAGIELELHLIDRDGRLAPRADDLLAQTGSNLWTYECSLSMIEIHSSPESSVQALDESLRTQVKAAAEVADSLGLRLMPSSTIGPDVPLARPGTRYRAKEVLLAATRPLEYQIAGTHVHVDSGAQVHERFNLLTWMDPLFAAVSSTPFLAGTNGVNCHRVQTYRRNVFEQFPEYGSLLGYFEDDASLVGRFHDLHERWIERLAHEGLDAEGFSPLNTYWGPVRLSSRTVEARGLDSNTVGMTVAAAAAYLGAARSQDAGLGYERTGIERIRELEELGFRYGVRADPVREHLEQVLAYAREGLDEEERTYLAPIERVLETRENTSDSLISYAREHDMLSEPHAINTEAVPKFRSELADRFERDLYER